MPLLPRVPRPRRAARPQAFAFALALVAAIRVPAAAQGPHDPLPHQRGLPGLALAARRVGVAGSVLYITAHPDDENNGLLVALGVGKGLRTALLTLTRGEGGQNEIGPELGDELGVLRTAELVAVHRFDGAEQLFSRAYEFGYSFSVEETFDKWGREATLGDIVRVVRHVRPDVILTMMPEGEGGGQHHQASARLASEAFDAAADPERFPEHLEEGLRPWRALRLFRVPFVASGASPPAGAWAIPTGRYDPWLGESWAELGARARNLHRCQGMNAPPVPGPVTAWVLPARGVAATSADDPPSDLFEGLETGLAAAARRRVGEEGVSTELLEVLSSIEARADRVRQSFAASRLRDTAREALEGLAAVRGSRGRLADLVAASTAESAAIEELDFLLREEERDWTSLAGRAHQLRLTATLIGEGAGSGSLDGRCVGGEDFAFEVRLVNGGESALEASTPEVRAPAGWSIEAADAGPRRPGSGEVAVWRFRGRVAADAKPSGPHWGRASRDDYRHETRASGLASARPFDPPLVTVSVPWRAEGGTARIDAIVAHREHEAATGAQRSRGLLVAPELSVSIEPATIVLPRARAARGVELSVAVREESPRTGPAVVRLEAPTGWRVEPPESRVELPREGATITARFRVWPDVDDSAWHELRAVVERGGGAHRLGQRLLDYPHIEARPLLREAVSRVRLIDVAVAPNLRVGYVMGVGDRVPEAIRDLGVEPRFLEREDLERGDLSELDTIVLGIRAYKDRDDLIASNARLLEWVREGGVLIVQYNKYEILAAPYGPYPFAISRPHDRVTDETAPVRILDPSSPVFRTPNPIGTRDWDGWVQERGLYFLSDLDPRHVPLLEIEDPFEYNRGAKRGALVVAEHGEGLWVYTGLALFRQLPEGVPGAYRLLANLLSLPRARDGR